MNYLLILVLLSLAIAYFWYITLVSRRNSVLEALGSVDVQMKLRFDLIPNILKIAQKFMDHEKSLLNDITLLRTQAQSTYQKNDTTSVAKHLQATEQLSHKLQQLMVSVENYPQLKSDQTMIQTMSTYNEVESQIAAARRFYNSSVAALNNAAQIFPGTLIASWANIQPMPYFKAEEAVQTPIPADFK
jgi:LemA protein